MKVTILALLGLVTVQATELPASDDLVERYHINRRADEDELLEKRRRHRRTDENDLVEKTKKKRRHMCSSRYSCGRKPLNY